MQIFLVTCLVALASAGTLSPTPYFYQNQQQNEQNQNYGIPSHQQVQQQDSPYSTSNSGSLSSINSGYSSGSSPVDSDEGLSYIPPSINSGYNSGSSSSVDNSPVSNYISPSNSGNSISSINSGYNSGSSSSVDNSPGSSYIPPLNSGNSINSINSGYNSGSSSSVDNSPVSNYVQPSNSGSSFSSINSGYSSGGSSSVDNSPVSNYISPSNSGNSINSPISNYVAPSNSGGNFNTINSGYSSGISDNSPVLNYVPPNFITHARPQSQRVIRKPIVTKSFYIHSAPEETEDEIAEELAELQQQPRQHYNVLFIKAPAQSSKSTALSLAKTLNEEKTVIYVLSKKTTATDLQDAIRSAPIAPKKPEVFFIKYRTPEEAVKAQREIQAQYDVLGGSSTISDEGYAPVSSVVGSLEQPTHESNIESSSNQGAQLINSYLPPSF